MQIYFIKNDWSIIAVVLKPVLENPLPCTFGYHPHLSHLIQLISSLVETARPEVGVSDKGDIQNVQCCGYFMERFENHCIIVFVLQNNKYMLYYNSETH